MLRRMRRLLACLVVLPLACSKTPPSAEPIASGAGAQAPAAPLVVTGAQVGQPAPAFELKDLDGKSVKLADFAGKVVVLEWFNPDCPFVKAAHGKGSLVDTAQRAARRNVVWLGVNSGALGKQGATVEANRAGVSKFGLSHPILLDVDGAVGHAYGATNTPQMYVIDTTGKLVYRGAIDNSPDGEGQSPQGGPLVNYVDQALDAVLAGKPVATPVTKAYGCGVKYAS